MTNSADFALDERKRKGLPIVLAVDDDPVHEKLMNVLAKRLGFTVYTARTCTEALELIETFSFDVILMDCRMPVVDGCECTQLIRHSASKTKDVPIVAVTADVMTGNKNRCLAAGMNDFLGKPFTLTEFHDKLCYWLDKKVE